MDLIYKTARHEIWEVREGASTVFYVYGLLASGDPRVVPSLGMARELCGGE